MMLAPLRAAIFSTEIPAVKTSYLKGSLTWGRHVQHHLKKTKVSKPLLALEFMCKNSCLRGFIFFFMLNDYTINLTKSINQT